MKFKGYHLYFILFVSVMCCDNIKTDANIKDVKSEVTSNKIDKSEIESLEFVDYILSTKSNEEVANWIQYQELIDGIDLIKKGDFSFLGMDKEIFDTYILELKETVPSNVKTKPVSARLLALETSLLKSYEIFNINGAKKQEKLDALHMLFISMSNLNLQINKKFEFEGISSSDL